MRGWFWHWRLEERCRKVIARHRIKYFPNILLFLGAFGAMPFSILIMNSAFNNLDISLEEASLDLGETQFGTFRRVILPLVYPGIMASLLLGFTLSLDEFIIAFFLTGTETTLPVYIWSLFRFPKQLPTTMALGTILIIVSLILLSLSEYFRRRAAKTQNTVL